MVTADLKKHWERIYGEKTESQLSWHQDDPAVSLELSELAGVTPGSSVIDIGGGTSRYAPSLVEKGLGDVTVLDVSRAALDAARRRIGEEAEKIQWVAANVTTWEPSRRYDLWHDRAVFHFLIDQKDRAAYIDRLSRCLKPGGHAIMATFALDGPETCSGLPVVRYDPESLGRTLGERFELIASRLHEHRTPWGSPQSFQFSLFRKRA